MLLQGYDADDIAKELNLSKEHVRNILSEQVGDLTVEVQALQERVNVITYARLERAYKRIEARLEPPTKDGIRSANEIIDNKSLADLTKTELAILKLQTEVAKMKPAASPDKDTAPNGMTLTQVTITADSPHYQRAIESMQQRLGILPDDMPWIDADVEEIPEGPQEERIEKLEKIVNELTSDHETAGSEDG